MNVSIDPNAGQADVATSYVETYKAKAAFSNGSVQTTIPSGWTVPQSSSSGAPGYVSAARGTCTSVGAPPSVTPVTGGTQVTVTGVTCPANGSFTLTYSQADPLNAGNYTFGPTTVRATSSATSVSIPSPAVNATAGPTTRLVVTAASTVTAGMGLSFTVTPEDAGGDVSAYHGTVAITSSDHGTSTVLPPATTIGGAHTFNATLTTAGTQTITATDTGTSSISGSTSVLVTPAAATHLSVSAPASASIGQPVSVTVTALDRYGNTATGYRGTVHFTGTDRGSGSSVPTNYAFTGGDAGAHTFTNAVTFVTAGTQTVTATDTAMSSITGTSGGVSVSAASATHFSVSAPATATAGQPVGVTVTALDPSNHVVTGYRGTVHFTLTDTGAGSSLPADYAFTGSDGGSHTFTGGVAFVTAGSQTVTATDTGTSSITGTSPGVSVSAASATHLSVSAPLTATAGQAVGVTVTALDQFGNTATGYRGTVHFTSSDTGAGLTLPAGYSFAGGDAGSHTFTNSVTFVTAGSQTVTATDIGTSSITGTSPGVSVTAAPATRLSVSAPAVATAGQAVDVTVTALDQFGNAATGYRGTVHLTATDTGAGLPADYTFVAGDGGSHTFTSGVAFVTAGSQTVTATDTGTSSLTGTSAGVSVSAASATRLSVSAPATAMAGQGFSVTVTALDQFGNAASGYRGTVHFTSSDTGAGRSVPPDYTFVGVDAGSHTFTSGVTLVTAGAQTVTATDASTGSITGTSSGVSVSAAPATHFLVSVPSTAIAGQAVSVTVTALDEYGKAATGYRGTVRFTSSDTGRSAALPADVTFVAGDAGSHTLAGAVTFVTAGSQNVTATDTGTSSITGTSAGVVVSAASATHLAVSAPASVTAGAFVSVGVTALDQFGNTASGYRGTVHFSSSDTGAGVRLPADYTFRSGDGGVHVFVSGFTFVTVGSQTVTATDTGAGSISGTSSGISVSAATGTHFLVSVPSSATAGQAFGVTVTAVDQFDNVVTGYRGTVHFTSTDTGGGAGLPADYTFVAGDAGSHMFTGGVTFVTAGGQAVTATDTGASSITGMSAAVSVVAASATHLAVSAPASATSGEPVNFTVTALDQFGNTASGYRGTVHFTSSDTSAGVDLPGDYTFTSRDGGVHAFVSGVTFVAVGSQTVTATDTATSSVTGTSSGISVSVATGTHFLVSVPSSATAGQAFGVTVTAVDQFDNVVAGYRGTVHFTSTDTGGGAGLPADYTFVAGDAGSHMFTGGVTFVTAGGQAVTATDTGASSITGTSAGVSVAGASATHLAVSAPASATAGQPISVTVVALDQFGNTASGYRGTVHFTSSDTAAGVDLPADYSFVAADGGVHAFVSGVTFVAVGSQTVTATDTATSSVTGTSSGVSVSAGSGTHFLVSVPSSATAGQAFGVTVTAVDQFGNIVTGYRGTVHFTSTDTGAGVGLPGDYTFVAGDAGSHTFTAAVTFVTAGGQAVTATDTGPGSITGTSAAVSVTAASATHLAVSAPAGATAGQPVSFTVTAVDQFGNTASGYRGTVHFTSSDTGAGVDLPADYSFVAGDGGVHVLVSGVTFVTVGSQTVTATDTATSSVTGTSSGVSVSSGSGTHFRVSVPSSATAGQAVSVTVTAVDQFDNAVTGYRGTVHFTSTDTGSGAVLPADYTFVAADGGSHTFTGAVTFVTAGGQAVTATDTGASSITGTSAGVLVSAASATHLAVSAPASATTGQAVDVTVAAVDQYGNTAAGYRGTVHFTSTDTGSGTALPTDYTFTAGDNGSHTFTAGVSFATAGTHTITARDTITSSIVGTSTGVTVSEPPPLLPAIPNIDVNFPDDPQVAVVPPQDVTHCPAQDSDDGGCAINALDGTIDNTFDASSSVDPNVDPSHQDQVSYHWQIFYPSIFGEQVLYSAAGITGYHSPVLHIVAGSLPELDGDPRVGADIFWRVELTITITAPHRTIDKVVYFRFAYSSDFSLQISSDCQLTGFFGSLDCSVIAPQLLPATEPV